jgi:hypothetical protein
MSRVEKEFPNADIKVTPGGILYTYVVRDTNGCIWYVDVTGFKNDTVQKTKLFEAK